MNYAGLTGSIVPFNMEENAQETIVGNLGRPMKKSCVEDNGMLVEARNQRRDFERKRNS